MAISFVAIMNATPAGRVAKYANFPTQAAAAGHVALNLAQFPEGFDHVKPDEPFTHWLIDMPGKSISVVTPTPTPVVELPDTIALRDLADALGPRFAAIIEAQLGPRP